ncbi:MAG: putative toxin-antitoxin system toxin component, PIN family [Planctomycetia bacterium]|nr:putative toxin-antitoxin system toxin component, PIN family [Planctomycetia bacterium]
MSSTPAILRAVLDTSVLVAGSRSRRGASFAVLQLVGSDAVQPCLSVALYVEWQQALSRPENVPPGIAPETVTGFLRFLAGKSHLQEIYFLWRPVLQDPNDDMVLELAVASRCPLIVTHNVRDFAGVERFGIEAVTPAVFLRRVRGE